MTNIPAEISHSRDASLEAQLSVRTRDTPAWPRSQHNHRGRIAMLAQRRAHAFAHEVLRAFDGDAGCGPRAVVQQHGLSADGSRSSHALREHAPFRVKASARILDRIQHFACAAGRSESELTVHKAGFVVEQEALKRE